MSCDDLTDCTVVWAAVLYCSVSAVLWCRCVHDDSVYDHTTVAHIADCGLTAGSISRVSESVVTGAASRFAADILIAFVHAGDGFMCMLIWTVSLGSDRLWTCTVGCGLALSATR